MSKCRYPITVKYSDKAYHKHMRMWRNAGSNPDTKPTMWHEVPCGKCASCINSKRMEWLFRYEEHARVQPYASYFVTLTYEVEPVKGYRYSDVQKYIKKLRHLQKEKITYSVISDYGDQFGRGHFHILLFNIRFDSSLLVEKWKHGTCFVGKVQPGSVGYVVKHNLNKNKDVPEGKLPKRNWKSQGIAKHLVSESWKKYLQNGNSFKYHNKFRIRTPHYFAQKMEINPYLIPYRPKKEESLENVTNLQFYVDRYNARSKRLMEQLFK